MGTGICHLRLVIGGILFFRAGPKAMGSLALLWIVGQCTGSGAMGKARNQTDSVLTRPSRSTFLFAPFALCGETRPFWRCRPVSFHSNYGRWLRMAQRENCPVCRNLPMPEGMVDIVELPSSWLSAEPIECLKGACHLTAKQHVVELFELSESELLPLA